MTDSDQRVLDSLSSLIEPETQQSLVKLGMIRDIRTDGSTVALTLLQPVPGYPHTATLKTDIQEAIQQLPNAPSSTVTVREDTPSNPQIAERIGLQAKSLIAISSGKGGVGKSTVAVNLAVALAQYGAKVGLLDADILGPNLPMMVGVDSMPMPSSQRLIPAEAYGIKVVSMGFLIDPGKPMVWRGPMVHAAIRQFFSDVEWGEQDYIIVDLPPGTGDAQLTLAQSVPLTGAVVVTQPQNVAVGDAKRGLQMFRHVKVPIIGVVENMSGDFFGAGGGQSLAMETNVPLLASIPLDPQVRIGGDSGTPVVVSHPDSEAARAFRQLAIYVAARSNAIIVDEADDVIPLTTIE